MTRHRFSQKLTNGDLQAVSDLYYALNRARSDDDLAGIVKLRNMARTMELKGHGSLKGLQKQIVYLSYQQLTDEQDAALETFMNVLHDRADQNGI